jgi:hypothetical protein
MQRSRKPLCIRWKQVAALRFRKPLRIFPSRQGAATRTRCGLLVGRLAFSTPRPRVETQMPPISSSMLDRQNDRIRDATSRTSFLVGILIRFSFIRAIFLNSAEFRYPQKIGISSASLVIESHPYRNQWAAFSFFRVSCTPLRISARRCSVSDHDDRGAL